MNFFFAPVSSSLPFLNYQKTVVNGIRKVIFEKHKISFESWLVGHKGYLWGLKSSATSKWLQIENGDIILFYHKGFIISYSAVVSKFENKELSEELWGYFENKNIPKFYWSLVIVLSKSHPCKIPFTIFKEILGFDKSYTLKSFFKLKDPFSEFLRSRKQSFEEFAVEASIL